MGCGRRSLVLPCLPRRCGDGEVTIARGVSLRQIRLAPGNPDYNATLHWKCHVSSSREEEERGEGGGGRGVFFTGETLEDSKESGREEEEEEEDGGEEKTGLSSWLTNRCVKNLRLGHVMRVQFIVEFADGSKRYEDVPMNQTKPDLLQVTLNDQPLGLVSSRLLL